MNCFINTVHAIVKAVRELGVQMFTYLSSVDDRTPYVKNKKILKNNCISL